MVGPTVGIVDAATVGPTVGGNGDGASDPADGCAGAAPLIAVLGPQARSSAVTASSDRRGKAIALILLMPHLRPEQPTRTAAGML